MNPETRNCQNCKTPFTIDGDDFSFYDKIKVPPPTFCPECRMVRRLMWRNARSLNRRECGMCNKVLISMYKDDGVPVYCANCWNGGGWEPMSYGFDYDFSQNFFIQLKDLFYKVPRFYSYQFGNLVNSEYANFSKDNKNVYLSFSVTECEDVMYVDTVDKSKNSIDDLACQRLDGCSWNINCEGNYNTHYAVESQNNIDSYFIYDCTNCSNCYMSSNLRNQQYYFKNQKLSREDYLEAIKSVTLDTFTGIENSKTEFKDMIQNQAIHKYAFIYSAESVNGDYIHHAKNLKHCFDCNQAENLAYSVRGIEIKDSYDISGTGFSAELIYEAMAATGNTNSCYFAYLNLLGCRSCQYSLILKNCADCFACVGLTNAQYCIFNKQYTKEEYFEMVEKIKQHMDEMPYVDEKGRVFKYGEFFPYDMSPFAYNEAQVFELFPISKEQVIASGFNWRDRDARDYNTTMNANEIPESINDISDNITSEVIACPSNGNQMTQCTTAYRIMPDEFIFYKNKGLPIPRYCPNCRHYERLCYRNTMRLYHRECTNGCGNTFDTTFDPGRPEKVYCERCYQQEVL